MSLVVAGHKILPKRLVVAVKKYLPYGGGGVLDHPSHNEGAINSGHINLVNIVPNLQVERATN